MERIKAIEGMDTHKHEEPGLELKCNSCGGNLIMSDKGLACPNCDQVKRLVVKRTWYGRYEILEAQNVFSATKSLTAEQCEALSKLGVNINVRY